ncbi:MAG: DUF433 domain-containing protein [Fuerstiella sp.]
MTQFDRITFDPAVMGGKPCVRGQRVTVGTVLGLLAAGRSRDEILRAYPYLESEDIDQCLAYAAWRMEERDVPYARAMVADLMGLEDDDDLSRRSYTLPVRNPLRQRLVRRFYSE